MPVGATERISSRKKLESRGHATWREYQDTGGVYHLFSKKLYAEIGKENLRNRRRHSVEFIRTRLVLLDFVIANQQYDYLETEEQKVEYFCKELGASKDLPSDQDLRRQFEQRANTPIFCRQIPSLP